MYEGFLLLRLWKPMLVTNLLKLIWSYNRAQVQLSKSHRHQQRANDSVLWSSCMLDMNFIACFSKPPLETYHQSQELACVGWPEKDQDCTPPRKPADGGAGCSFPPKPFCPRISGPLSALVLLNFLRLTPRLRVPAMGDVTTWQSMILTS